MSARIVVIEAIVALTEFAAGIERERKLSA